MNTLIADCPRCNVSNMTFTIKAWSRLAESGYTFEVCSLCRACKKSSIFKVRKRQHSFPAIEQLENINNYYDVEGFVNVKDNVLKECPEFVPDNIEAIFIEGMTCVSTECWNAAGAMFRQCLDLATKPLLPSEDVNGLNKQKRRNLASRLTWLFENNSLPDALRDLASCIREDGNDAAHDGTLSKEDALDLLDFTKVLLERIYTEKGRLERAAKRREERRATKAK